jgi:CRISPR system Cascade subunit CasA
MLAAILQDIYSPRCEDDLAAIWEEGCFPEGAIRAFGEQYARRFDLFSPDAPFLQSADLPLQPTRGDNVKSVAYLCPEKPSGTGVTHYHHGSEDDQCFCPACLAEGLLAVAAFATSGGAGIKPSINGVPPIYVLPAGSTLLESLLAAMVLPEYLPRNRAEADEPWWRHAPYVGRDKEVLQVGYLHSLTFPARRIRLHPREMDTPCTRCGESAAWGAGTMIFDMGECRPKDAAFWQDPFAAYRIPEKEAEKGPTPIRPNEGKALWREYAALFLKTIAITETRKGVPAYRILRPTVLDQLAALTFWPRGCAFSFRCVGMRTDMKAKIFELVDAGFEVPPPLLADPLGGMKVQQALAFAGDCAAIAGRAFQDFFGGRSKSTPRHRRLRTQMEQEYWRELAAPFRQLALEAADPTRYGALFSAWVERAVRTMLDCFSRAAAETGEDSAALRQRVQAENAVSYRLNERRKKELENA